MPMRWTILAVGVVVIAGGVWSVQGAWPWPGPGAILATGLACLLLAVTADRITSIKVDAKNKAVSIGLALAEDARKEITQLGLPGLAATYAFVHHQLANDPASLDLKIRLQDQLVDIARANSLSEPVTAAEIATAITSGPPAKRVLAFGILEGNPHLATCDLLTQGISGSLSGNEQYHALLASEAAWPSLTPECRRALRKSIDTSAHIPQDSDRAAVAARIRQLPF